MEVWRISRTYFCFVFVLFFLFFCLIKRGKGRKGSERGGEDLMTNKVWYAMGYRF